MPKKKGRGWRRHPECQTSARASLSSKTSMASIDNYERTPSTSEGSSHPWEQACHRQNRAPCGFSPRKPSGTGLCWALSLGRPHTRRRSPPAVTPHREEGATTRLHTHEGNHGGSQMPGSRTLLVEVNEQHRLPRLRVGHHLIGRSSPSSDLL